MKIVIDIHEETIRKIKNELYCGIDDPDLYKAIEDGKILPKRHGRLIDADAFERNIQNEWENNEISNSEWIQFREWLKDEPTIIEADKEAEHGKEIQ